MTNSSLNQTKIKPINNKEGKSFSVVILTTTIACITILLSVYFFVGQTKQKLISKENIKVIEANPGPIKIKPKNPGGMLILHQDTNIYDFLDKTQKDKKPGQKPPMLKTRAKPSEIQIKAKRNKRINPNFLKETKMFEIQIAALSSKKAALLFWKKISADYSNIFLKLKPNFQEVNLPSKGKYFRLRVGPIKRKSLAINLCKNLKTKKMECFVVEP
ncbi:MAG: SPOR domain-containing protein [Pseudomonadota bacterium]|nr:SPOR domain-containing protein [Pseudomonadota bacterium]